MHVSGNTYTRLYTRGHKGKNNTCTNLYIDGSLPPKDEISLCGASTAREEITRHGPRLANWKMTSLTSNNCNYITEKSVRLSIERMDKVVASGTGAQNKRRGSNNKKEVSF